MNKNQIKINLIPIEHEFYIVQSIINIIFYLQTLKTRKIVIVWFF